MEAVLRLRSGSGSHPAVALQQAEVEHPAAVDGVGTRDQVLGCSPPGEDKTPAYMPEQMPGQATATRMRCTPGWKDGTGSVGGRYGKRGKAWGKAWGGTYLSSWAASSPGCDIEDIARHGEPRQGCGDGATQSGNMGGLPVGRGVSGVSEVCTGRPPRADASSVSPLAAALRRERGAQRCQGPRQRQLGCH